MVLRLPLLAFLILAFSAQSLAQTPDNSPWDRSFGIPGIHGSVGAADADGDDIFLAGNFSFAGDLQADNVVRWNRATQTFSGVGGGLVPLYNEHFAIDALVATEEAVFVGGSFRAYSPSSGGNLTHFARYDRTTEQWSSPAGDTPLYPVSAMVRHNDALYIAAGHLFRYDLNTGQVTIESDVIAAMFALESVGDHIYVGGRFSMLGDLEAHNIARYTPSTGEWTTLGEGDTNGIQSVWVGNQQVGQVNTLAFHDGMLYVGGEFGAAGGQVARSLAAWDAAAESWSEYGGGLRAYYLPSSGGTINVPGKVAAIGFDSAGRLYAVGTFTRGGGNTNDGVPLNSIGRYANEAWQALDSGNKPAMDFGAVLGDLFLVGNGWTSPELAASVIAMWNITAERWEALSSGPSQGVVHGTVRDFHVRADGSLLAIAEGASIGNIPLLPTVGGGARHTVVRWTAAGWVPLAGNLSALLDAREWLSLNVLAEDDEGIVYAGGSIAYDIISGGAYYRYERPFLGRWDGQAWTHLAGAYPLKARPVEFNPGTFGSVHALEVSEGELYIGGVFVGANLGGTTLIPGTENLVKYDLATGQWIATGGVSTYVYALAVDRPRNRTFYGGVQIAGRESPETSSELVSVHSLARGEAIVSALTIHNSKLYTGGTFTHSHDVAASNVAVMDLTTDITSTLGSGVTAQFGYGRVTDFAFSGHDVYVTGQFDFAGGQSSRGVAVWDGAMWSGFGRGLEYITESGGLLAGRGEAVAVYGGDQLFVGGAFSLAGGAPSFGVARYFLNPQQPSGDAIVRITHASAALAFVGPVELRVGGELMATLAFGEGTPPLTLPAGVPLAINLRAVNNPSLDFSFEHTLAAGNFIVTVTGAPEDLWPVLANPFDHDLALKLIEKLITWEPAARGGGGSVGVLATHAVSDAPSLSISISGGGQVIDAELEYGAASAEITLTPGPYVFTIRDARDDAYIGAYAVDLSDHANQVVQLSIAGFVDPAANQGGPAMTLFAVDETGTSDEGEPVSSEPSTNLPAALALAPAYPNPSAFSATIRYAVPTTGAVGLSVYDSLGRRVAVLADGPTTAGWHEVSLDAGRLAAGVYIVRLHNGEASATQRLTVVR